MANRAEIISLIKQKLLEAEGGVNVAPVVASSTASKEEILLKPWTDEVVVIKYLIDSFKLSEKYAKLIHDQISSGTARVTTNGYTEDIAYAESERCYDELAKFFGNEDLKTLLF
jgi:hypothetical protein